MTTVIDASVLLAFFLDEPGGEVLATGKEHLCLSGVNLAEVLAKVDDRGQSIDDALEVLRHFAIEHFEHNREDAVASARLRGSTRKHGLSLGDRACLALAMRLGAGVLTADKAWAKLDLGLDIRLIR